MADGYDRFDNEGGNAGSSFVMGLLTGTVLGAGLGMLFAPKAGSELRSQLSEKAGNLANTASDGVRRASETASEWADKSRELVEKGKEAGREAYDRTREAVSRGSEEAQRYVRDASSNISSNVPGSSTSTTGGSPTSSSTRRS